LIKCERDHKNQRLRSLHISIDSHSHQSVSSILQGMLEHDYYNK